MDRIVFLLDTVSESELSATGLKADARSIRLYRYLDATVKKERPDAVTTMVFAAPGPGKHSAKEYRNHADKVAASLAKFDPTLIVCMGKSAMYPLESFFPSDFPKSKKYQKMWGRYFPINHLSGVSGKTGPTCVFTPSPSMLWAAKDQEGGYLYLRTIHENVMGAVLRTTDRIDTVSVLVSDRTHLDAVTEPWFAPAGRLRRLAEQATISVDTETTGLNIITDKVRTVQFSVADGESLVVIYDVLKPEEWTAFFNRLRTAGWTLVLQNGKYDYKILRSNGTTLGAYQELSIAHVLLDEREGTHNLDFIGQQVLGSGKTTITTEQLVNGPIDGKFVHYAGRDTDITRRAYVSLRPGVQDRPAYRILTQSAQLLAEGEHYGIRLDMERLAELDAQATGKLAEYRRIFKSEGINPNSPQQVAKRFGLTATDKKVLEHLDDELATAIVDYRGLKKVKGTYLDRLMASGLVDGRFHPDIRLAGPVTGRTSSGSGTVEKGNEFLPINSQNIPRPGKGQKYKYFSEALRAELRSLFIADEGRVILAFDLAAAEMRWAANHCMDPVMIADLNRKVDTHSLLTVMAYGLDKKHEFEIDFDNPENWIKHVRPAYEFERDGTKAATFATLYGGGIPAIAAQAKCDNETAELLRSTIYGRYKGLEQWINEIHNRVKTQGVVQTRYGRQRIFPYNSGVFDNRMLQSMLREAQNYVIQADASDYCLMAINNFMLNNTAAQPVYLQNFVHDAGYFSVVEDEADRLKKELVDLVQTADKLPAIMYADAKYAQNWGDL